MADKRVVITVNENVLEAFDEGIKKGRRSVEIERMMLLDAQKKGTKVDAYSLRTVVAEAAHRCCEQATDYPGSCSPQQVFEHLLKQGIVVNRVKVGRLLNLMEWEIYYPKSKTNRGQIKRYKPGKFFGPM
jgi:hypothetical protein